MQNLYDVLVKPVVTEKSSGGKGENKLTVVVAKDANKKQIVKAAFEMFKLKVTDVNTCNYRGKTKRIGKSTGKLANWKKAILTVADGSDLDVFGEVASKEG